MKIEALNCPNCGGNVTTDSSFCRFCGSRLKTLACPKCLGLMFEGAKHCTHCGEPVAAVATLDKKLGNCPRCDRTLNAIAADDLVFGQCERCEGVWIDVESFERICADQEKQAAVMKCLRPAPATPPAAIRYVPCPECRNLMNRSNFARSSGVIIDTCKTHGVWCDADELPKIIDFIRNGGIDRQRDKEKQELDERRRELLELEREEARRAGRLPDYRDRHSSPLPADSIKEFLRVILD